MSRAGPVLPPLGRSAVRQRKARRVFGVDDLACPTCGKVMVLRAEVRPPATLTVLASLERSDVDRENLNFHGDL
ncbi:MAG: hypothetical protein EA397_00705 [Deltaproteobacteria bacterium]|nr:MAG: hypothetical protein EA397_00705 [Deltaproteobacteria bacterium]